MVLTDLVKGVLDSKSGTMVAIFSRAIFLAVWYKPIMRSNKIESAISSIFKLVVRTSACRNLGCVGCHKTHMGIARYAG